MRNEPKEARPLRIFMIGGTGFIGEWTVRTLLSQGHEVLLFHRGRTQGHLLGQVEEWIGERDNLREFVPSLRAFSPDAVIDTVAYTKAQAQAVIDAVSGIAGRLVIVSSVDVYRAYGALHRTEETTPETGPLTEEAPLRTRLFPHRKNPLRPNADPHQYLDDADKILVERAVMEAKDLRGVVLRLPMVYGPGDPDRHIRPYLRRMDDQRRAILVQADFAAWPSPRMYVEDAAWAVTLAASHASAPGRIFHVAEPEALSEAAWIAGIGLAAGWHGEILAVPKSVLPQSLCKSADFSHQWRLNSARIRAELGYAETVSRQEALSRTIAWERAHPPISERPIDYAVEDSALGEWAGGRARTVQASGASGAPRIS